MGRETASADALLGEVVYRRCLGGLDVWAVPRPSSRQKAAVLSIDYGSVDLHLRARDSGPVQTTPAGTAHFLEHCLFAKPSGDIAEQINRLGGDVNASTSFTSTIFSLTCIEHFAAHLDLLFELALGLHIQPTERRSGARNHRARTSDELRRPGVDRVFAWPRGAVWGWPLGLGYGRYAGEPWAD